MTLGDVMQGQAFLTQDQIGLANKKHIHYFWPEKTGFRI